MNARHFDSGISAFLKSDIGGMSTKQLEAAAERIKTSTGNDPLIPVRDPLQKSGIDLAFFTQYIIDSGYQPYNWDLSKIINEIKRKQILR